MIQNLLAEYAKTQRYLIDIEHQKHQIELNLIDLNSKETMTKLQMKLESESENYKEICFRLQNYKAELIILDKKVSLAREVAHMFNDITEFNNFVNTLNTLNTPNASN
jgi:hypothetical protein